jgi:hypothetical protein
MIPISPTTTTTTTTTTTSTNVNDINKHDSRNKDDINKLPSASGIARFDVDEIIRAEYDAWAFRYGKNKEEERFEIFRSNFMTQMDFNLLTGKFFLLNEYGDMTSEEYEANQLSLSNDNSQNGFVQNSDDLDEKAIVAVFNQVICDEDEESMYEGNDQLLYKIQSTWDEYSFAMDTEEDDDDDDDVFNYIVRPLEDAPVAETHHILCMGSSVLRVSSPEVQTSRISSSSIINERNTKTPTRGVTKMKGGFATGRAVSSLFGALAPMGSNICVKKNILE